jgi:hypothetical protein
MSFPRGCEKGPQSPGSSPAVKVGGKRIKQKHRNRAARWLTLVTLATQEAEIGRIVVRSQPRQIVHQTLSRKKPITKKGLAEWLKV